MSKCTEIREICGDYAFDVEYSADNVFTMYFNSRRNAETVKRCIEADDSVPNVATAVDFVEVVRCRDCKHYGGVTYGFVCRKYSGAETKVCTEKYHYCSYGERSEKENLNAEEIANMPREAVYERYKEKKRMCKTVAQEVKMITSDTEMLMIRERLWGDEFN